MNSSAISAHDYLDASKVRQGVMRDEQDSHQEGSGLSTRPIAERRLDPVTSRTSPDLVGELDERGISDVVGNQQAASTEIAGRSDARIRVEYVWRESWRKMSIGADARGDRAQDITRVSECELPSVLQLLGHGTTDGFVRIPLQRRQVDRIQPASAVLFELMQNRPGRESQRHSRLDDDRRLHYPHGDRRYSQQLIPRIPDRERLIDSLATRHPQLLCE